LAIVDVLADVPTMTQDQLFKLSSVQKVQQRPQDGTLRNTEQKQLLTGQLTIDVTCCVLLV